MLMDHILGPFLSKGRVPIIIKDLSSLLLNILSCCILGRTPQPIPNRSLHCHHLMLPCHFVFSVHRREEAEPPCTWVRMLGLISHVTNENVSCKMTTVKTTRLLALAGDIMITWRSLDLLNVSRSVLTTHFSFSGRVNCPSAIEAGHAIAQMKEIHAHDE